MSGVGLGGVQETPSSSEMQMYMGSCTKEFSRRMASSLPSSSRIMEASQSTRLGSKAITE